MVFVSFIACFGMALQGWSNLNNERGHDFDISYVYFIIVNMCSLPDENM